MIMMMTGIQRQQLHQSGHRLLGVHGVQLVRAVRHLPDRAAPLYDGRRPHLLPLHRPAALPSGESALRCYFFVVKYF